MASPQFDIGVQSQLWAESTSLPVLYKETCPSTNDWAKELHPLSTSAQLLLTSHQTAGRGRGDKSWIHGSPGDSLFSSWVFQLEDPPRHLTGPVFGLALYNAVKSVWPSLRWSLKAPNDLYLDDKKVAGLLIESISGSHQNTLILGLGFNVFSTPSELPLATHLTGDLGIGDHLPVDTWRQFLKALFSQLQIAKSQCTAIELSSSLRELLVEALNLNPHRPGLFIDVSANGDLVLENEVLHWQDL